MKLSYVVGSPNCRKVHALIAHLGLEVEFDYLDFFSGELRSPAFLTLNPNGRVPVLRDGELVLWESNAILTYLADSVAPTPLYPQDLRLRADVMRWLCWELAHYNRALGQLAFEAVIKPGMLHQSADAARVARLQAELQQHAPVLEQALEGREYLAGPALTIADYAVAHLEMFADAVPFGWTAFPRIQAYYARMRAQPHWVATAPSSPQAIGRKPA